MVNWPEIVEQCGPYVWRTAYRLLSDREEANECYQETFLEAVDEYIFVQKTGPPTPGKPSAGTASAACCSHLYWQVMSMLSNASANTDRSLAPF